MQFCHHDHRMVLELRMQWSPGRSYGFGHCEVRRIRYHSPRIPVPLQVKEYIGVEFTNGWVTVWLSFSSRILHQFLKMRPLSKILLLYFPGQSNHHFAAHCNESLVLVVNSWVFFMRSFQVKSMVNKLSFWPRRFKNNAASSSGATKAVTQLDGARKDESTSKGEEKMKGLHDCSFRDVRDISNSQSLLKNEASIDMVTQPSSYHRKVSNSMTETSLKNWSFFHSRSSNRGLFLFLAHMRAFVLFSDQTRPCDTL